MAVFLLTSFVSFMIVSLALTIQPSKLKANPIPIPWIGDLTLLPSARLRWRRMLFYIFLVTGLAVAGLLLGGDLSSHLNYYLPNIMFGLIFGPVFALWIRSLIRVKNATFTMAHAVSGSLLIVLFVAGLLGAETARLAEYYSRRITKVGVGGTELTFGELGRARQESATPVTATPPNFKPSTPVYEGPGLQNLADLDFLMDRDCAIAGLPPNAKPPDCKEATANKTAASRWTAGDGSTFARITISGYAKCVSGLLTRTLDDDMAADHMRPFADRFNELSDTTKLDPAFAERARDTYLDASRELLGYLRPVHLALDDSKRDPANDAKTDASKDPRAEHPMRKACAMLLKVFCDPLALRQDSRAPDQNGAPNNMAQQKEDDAEAWVKTTDETQLQACLGDLKNAPGAETQGKLTELFKAFYREERDTGFRSRPYVAIAQASLMFQLERYEAAMSPLYEWINDYESYHRFDTAGTLQLGKDAHKVWYAIRARSVLYIYMDSWLSNRSTNAPDIVRDYHLANLQRYLELLRLFPPAVRIFQELNKSRKYDLEKDGYKTIAIDAPICGFDNYEAGLILTQLATGTLYAYHALNSRDYGNHEATVRKIVGDAMNADTSCIAYHYSPAYAAAFRSEALELQAQILMKDAAKKKSANDFAGAGDLLKKARDVIGLSLQTIDKAATSDRASKRGAKRFVEQITSTKALIAHETALRTKEIIGLRLSDLD
jgi:hypothetical protein